MNALIIADVGIRQDTDGRYCLNDFHKASGGEEKHSPNRFMRTDGCKSLINLITPKMAFSPVESKQQVGTFAVKQLVYAYAMWISAEFHLKVIDTFDAVVTGQIANPATMSRMQLIELAMQAEQERLKLEQKVEVLEPKAQALDRLATRADGSLCITNAAKDLQVQPKALFGLLSGALRWIYRRAGGAGWVAYQDKLQQGLLEHKVTVVSRSDGSEKLTEQVLVTPKGLAKLASVVTTNQPLLMQ